MFLHEREWRTPDSIDLHAVRPLGVLIDWSRINASVPGWTQALDASAWFNELAV